MARPARAYQRRLIVTAAPAHDWRRNPVLQLAFLLLTFGPPLAVIWSACS